MFFSVIIPIYNSAKSLTRCLESVKKQNFDDFEVIMVDDGSIDSSRVIAEMYSDWDQRYRYVYKCNEGVSSARNLGISLARGEYVVFLDSDDIYYATYLSTFRNMIEMYPDYGHYWCAFEAVRTNDTANGEKYCYDSNEPLSMLNRSNIMELHRKTLVSSLWNKVYRRDMIQNMKMRQHISLGEDELFNFEYLDRNPNADIVMNNIPQYGYSVGSNNTLNSMYRRNLMDIYDELNREERAFLIKWKVSEKQMEMFETLRFYRYERVLENTFHVQNRMEKREKYALNNRILHDIAFRTALRNGDVTVHPAMKMAYLTGRYEVVTLIKKAKSRLGL